MSASSYTRGINVTEMPLLASAAINIAAPHEHKRPKTRETDFHKFINLTAPSAIILFILINFAGAFQAFRAWNGE
jgi:hypothetical protein